MVHQSAAKSLFLLPLDWLHLRGQLRRMRNGVRLARRVWRVKRNYARVLKRIRAKPKNEKVRVLFLCGEPAKWKCQKLYEAMRDSGVFEPIVGLTDWNMQREERCTDAELDVLHMAAESFFDTLGDAHVRTYSISPRRGKDLRVFSPDIVFYSEPWSPRKDQTSEPVSEYALTFYISYFTPNYGKIGTDSQQPLHRFLFGYVTLNDWWKKIYRDARRPWNHAAEFLPLGFPSLDGFIMDENAHPDDGPVIYAPHFSFPTKLEGRFLFPISTFDWNGEAILQYAKEHAAFGWVFKPHPILRRYLVESGIWSKARTDAYYAEWEKLGVACYDGDYQDLFLRSRVLVTDSASFLTEYGATGKPVVHLIRKDNGVVPFPPSKAVYDTYYQVSDMNELQCVFKMVLEDGCDPLKDERLAAVRAAGIAKSHASENIVAYLRTLIKR